MIDNRNPFICYEDLPTVKNSIHWSVDSVGSGWLYLLNVYHLIMMAVPLGYLVESRVERVQLARETMVPSTSSGIVATTDASYKKIVH